MAKTRKSTDPSRYLSVSADPADACCRACRGVGCIRVSSGNDVMYDGCVTCDGAGKVPPRGELPRLWRSIGFDGCPQCRDTPDVEIALRSYWAGTCQPDRARENVPVWDGDVGAFTTLGALR